MENGKDDVVLARMVAYSIKQTAAVLVASSIHALARYASPVLAPANSVQIKQLLWSASATRTELLSPTAHSGLYKSNQILGSISYSVTTAFFKF